MKYIKLIIGTLLINSMFLSSYAIGIQNKDFIIKKQHELSSIEYNVDSKINLNNEWYINYINEEFFYARKKDNYISKGQILKLAEQEIQENQYDFDPYIILAICEIESKQIADSKNNNTYIGLGQVHKDKKWLGDLSITDLTDPIQNIKATCYCLQLHYDEAYMQSLDYAIRDYSGNTTIYCEYVSEVLSRALYLKTYGIWIDDEFYQNVNTYIELNDLDNEVLYELH